jgi:hypothetical protein
MNTTTGACVSVLAPHVDAYVAHRCRHSQAGVRYPSLESTGRAGHSNSRIEFMRSTWRRRRPGELFLPPDSKSYGGPMSDQVLTPTSPGWLNAVSQAPPSRVVGFIRPGSRGPESF